jgi:hypothetical protein
MEGDMNSYIKSGVVVFALSMLSGCAQPVVVDVVQPSDEGLSCDGLKEAYAEAGQFKEAAQKEKEWNKANIARAILSLPVLAATYMNSNKAIQAADSRKDHLTNLIKHNECENLDALDNSNQSG